MSVQLHIQRRPGALPRAVQYLHQRDRPVSVCAHSSLIPAIEVEPSAGRRLRPCCTNIADHWTGRKYQSTISHRTNSAGGWKQDRGITREPDVLDYETVDQPRVIRTRQGDLVLVLEQQVPGRLTLRNVLSLDECP